MSNPRSATTSALHVPQHNPDDYLWTMLTSHQVKSIDCSLFINASPRETKLPAAISPEAVCLLQNLSGSIYPIALRGKSQAGKSTTLNRLAQISNFPMTTPLLNVAKNFGATTTHGIWIMIIQFNNNDALLLFDTQGTDRGADEITHKLIAFTDHICTKVVDVFRMPTEGFSNEYINAHYCLAMGRESVKNLNPTSHKTIMWTNSLLPKQSPFDCEKSCNTPEAYHAEILECVAGERVVQAAKAKKYTEGTPIITTGQPPSEVLLSISELANNHPFIEKELMPAIQQILHNVQPVTYGAHEIKGGRDYVQYLSNIYSNIQTSVIDLPFCALPLVRSIGMNNLIKCKAWIENQIEQMLAERSNNLDWISCHLMHEMNAKKSQCIGNFEREMSDFPKDMWQEQVSDLTTFIEAILKRTVEKFKKSILEKFIAQNYEQFNQLCCLGFVVTQLKTALDSKMRDTIQLLEISAPLLHGNINDLDRAFVTQNLQVHIEKLCQIQRDIEQDWAVREAEFKQEIYSTDPGAGIDLVINKMVESHDAYCRQRFAQYNIHPRCFFDVYSKTQELKNDNQIQSIEVANKCRTKYISEFNQKIGVIFSANITVPEKYGKLLAAVETCLQQYYAELPWPLNDNTIGELHSTLQQQLENALNQLYTPAVQEQLKQDRIAQQQRLANQRFEENESLLWVHCVGCQRVFAGRTRGCPKVTCDRFKVDQGISTDHGCSLTFEWTKAQPANLSLLPSEFWFSKIEAGDRAGSARNMVNDAFTSVYNFFAPGSRILRRRRSSR